MKALASLKLAVLIILAVGIITAWGTIVESRFDALTAQKLVYHSVYMYAVLFMLCVNLIAVMVDRWPWRKKHTGFVLAHIGIIILILGSLVTRYYGIDGSMNFFIGQTNRYVTVGETDLTVYSSLDGERYTKLFDREVDFMRSSPDAASPMAIPLPAGDVKVAEFVPYALREEKIVASDKASDGPAVRFQLQNPNVNLTEWIIQTAKGKDVVKNLGPAEVVLTSQENFPLGKNAIVLKPAADGESLEYSIFSRREEVAVRRGLVKAGETVETGWMGMVLRVLKYLPNAKEEIKFRRLERPTPLTTPAIKVLFNAQEHWIGLNSLLKLFTADAVYIITYANRRLDIGFEMTLNRFTVGRYQGTMRAASYESVVNVPGKGEVTISMNEPLKHSGFTFYQASFSEDETGKPAASVLSVNWDPGRWIKYLGSLLIVLGSIHLFYFKRAAKKKAADA